MRHGATKLRRLRERRGLHGRVQPRLQRAHREPHRSFARRRAEVFAQYWSRDPQSATTTSLSNALSFVIIRDRARAPRVCGRLPILLPLSVASSVMNSNHAIGFCFVALAPLTRAQTLWNSVNGPMVGAEYGKVCILVPDQNSDGYGDLLVGAPGVNQGRGAVYCLSGAYLATGAGAQHLDGRNPRATG